MDILNKSESVHGESADLPSSYEKVCAICFWREKKRG